MKVLFAATEIYPYVKTGGLGDVCAALPPYLKERGVDIRLFLPGYDEVLANFTVEKTIVTWPDYFGGGNATLLYGQLENGMDSYVLDAPTHFRGRTPYVDSNGKDWPDNYRRFAAFCHAAVNMVFQDKSWKADILHGHDWPCGLIPAYVRQNPMADAKTILTIHNIAYQGIFPAHIYWELNLPDAFFAPEGLEYYSQVSFLKAGLYYADHISTVSPTYALEIRNSDMGCGMEGLLKRREKDLSGILNGMDCEIWCPFNDEMILHRYNSKSLEKKDLNRRAMIDQFKLDTKKDRPILGVVSRLSPQKGLDLVIDCAPEFLKEGCGLVVLGNGDRDLEQGFMDLARQYPGKVHVHTRYDETLAHRIQAGVDCMLMPSRAEPCGLVQMYALCYGTLPIVRNTGGLADSVVGFDGSNEHEATGFVFDDPTAEALQESIDLAIRTFADRKRWTAMQLTAMKSDFAWGGSAGKYVSLYDKVAQKS